MGMSIDEAIKQLTTYSIPCGKYKNAYDMAINTMRKYQQIVNENKLLSASITMMKADYNARLKADMVAMLAELQLEIENSVRQFRGDYSRGYNTALLDVDRNIQQKISAIKGEQE